MMKNTILAWLGVVTLAVSVGCVPSGGGGGGGSKKDSGVIDVGGSGGGGGGAGGAIGGSGGGQCTPACPEGRLCGPDGCGGVCGVCEGEQLCIDGACSDESCPAGTLACEGVCTELLTDADNCGNCGNACPRRPDTVTTCVDAECFLGCANQRSIDFENDPQHCGACATACPTAVGGEPWCSEGQCGSPCADNQEVCSGICVNTNNNDDHCGACDHVCPGSSNCNGGDCLCWQGETLCEDGCFNLARDVNNCGACGNVCPSPEGGEVACFGGECTNPCADGFVLGAACGGVCVDLDSNADNCGECGNACAAPFAGVNPRDCVRNTGGDCSGEVEGCAESTCLYRAEQTWGSFSGGDDVTCSAVCARHGLRCGQIHLHSCPNTNPDWQGIVFEDNPLVAGCVIYASRNGWGPDRLDCDTTVVSEEGAPYYAHRRVMNCWCEGDDPDEPVDPPAEALNAPGSYPMDRFSRGEHTLVGLHLNANHRVTLFTGDGAGGCPSDTVLRLLDAQGALIVEDDDGGFDVCSRIEIQLSAGDYQIEVQGYGAGPMPDYVLTVDW